VITASLAGLEADAERRFGGLRRLYGQAGYQRLRALRVAVVGVGGVGSWAAEALARCGVQSLTLIDLDHIAESNINRQVQALGSTVGAAKVQALRERIADIHPQCEVHAVEAFVEPGLWPGLLPTPVDAVIDACDHAAAKHLLAAWALKPLTNPRVPLVLSGAAGGKRLGHRVEVADLSEVTHDPLLANLRQRLRREGLVPRKGKAGLNCVFSREEVKRPLAMAEVAGGEVDAAGTGAVVCATDAATDAATDGTTDGSLNCHGYGSSVVVTAAFGLAAAAAVLEHATK
jgi:tRNA A37 threonylcarbamoyladenosine dehydratase